MRGDNEGEPPSKRRKLKPFSSSCSSSSSSVLDSSMAGDFIGCKGVRKVEFVRLIAESLHSLGYKESCEYLEKESGINLVSPVVNELTLKILDGNWDESLNSLRNITDLDESIVSSCCFVILEQKFLEFLNSHKVDDAIRTLRDEISLLSIKKNLVHELTMLLLSPFWGQDLVKQKTPIEVLHDVQSLFPPNIMIPEGRLLHLVEQALDSQHAICSFHNSLFGQTSLFVDHNCGRGQIPSQTLQILRGHQDEVWIVQFSHNGKFLASASKDKSVIIWEVSPEGRLEFKHRLMGHNEPVSCVSWSPDDNQILTCGVEEVMTRWDVFTGELLLIYKKDDLGIVSCSWNPDGNRVFTGITDKSVVMWDLDGNELESWKGRKTLRISDLQVTNDGKFIISMCKEKMILIFDKEQRNDFLIRESHNIVSFALSDDNQFMLLSLVNQEIHLWRIEGNFQLLAKYKGHKRSRFVIRACFGGFDQRFVASGSEDSQVCIWKRDSGELIKRLRGHSGAVNCTSWNPVNPHILASASDDRTIRIWGLNHVA